MVSVEGTSILGKPFRAASRSFDSGILFHLGKLLVCFLLEYKCADSYLDVRVFRDGCLEEKEALYL